MAGVIFLTRQSLFPILIMISQAQFGPPGMNYSLQYWDLETIRYCWSLVIDISLHLRASRYSAQYSILAWHSFVRVLGVLSATGPDFGIASTIFSDQVRVYCDIDHAIAHGADNFSSKSAPWTGTAKAPISCNACRISQLRYCTKWTPIRLI